MSPMIGFTKREILRGTVVTPGWYRVHIESIGEAPSKAGDSTNYPVEAWIIKEADTGDLKFAEVPLDNWMFNSKAISFAMGLLKAFNIDVEADKRYDLSALAGKDIEVFVDNKEYQGRIMNDVKHQYRPLRENA